MPAKRLPPEPWFGEVVELLVAEGLPLTGETLFRAAQAVGTPLSLEDAVKFARRQALRDAYAAVERSASDEAGDAAVHTKRILVGKLLRDADRLRAIGKVKEAADVTEKAAKLLGYVDDRTQINIFEQIRGDDILAMREEIEAQRASRGVN